MSDSNTYTYRFGCVPMADHPGWLVQSASKSGEAQEALALDNVGEPVVAHYYQKVNTMQFEVIIPTEESDSNIPTIGQVIPYGGFYWYVASVSLTENNTDYNRYSLQMKRFLKNELPNENTPDNP